MYFSWVSPFESVTRIPIPDRARDGTRNDQNDNLPRSPKKHTSSNNLVSFWQFIDCFRFRHDKNDRAPQQQQQQKKNINEGRSEQTCIEIKINIQDRYS